MSTGSQVNTFHGNHVTVITRISCARLPWVEPPKLIWSVSLILRKCPSNQWTHERHLGGSRQKAILKVKSILYRLPSTKEVSAFIFHNLNASVYSNIYLTYLLLVFKEAGMQRQGRLLYNMKFIISKHMKMNTIYIHCHIGQMAFLWTWTPVPALSNYFSYMTVLGNRCFHIFFNGGGVHFKN